MFTLSSLKLHAAVVVAALTVASVSPALHAQTFPGRTQVTVPFGFEVGSAHFAPGTYILSNVREDIVQIQSGKHSALALSSHETNLNPSTTSKVVFYRYGNRYFLREVWRKGDVDHIDCSESKDERRARNDMQNNHRASVSTPTTVEVALLQLPR